MSQILELLAQQLGPQTIAHIGQQIGADPRQTQNALSAALPMIIGGLARNANSTQGGADALASALDRDHAGGTLLDSLPQLIGQMAGGGGGGGGGIADLLGAVGGLLGGMQQQQAPARPKAVDGDGILRHVLGDKRPAVEQGVARASGLDLGSVAQLMTIVGPMVMGALGKAKTQSNLDASGLAGMLATEQNQISGQSSMVEGLLGAVLDKNHDGEIADDVTRLGLEFAGKQLLQGLFG